MREEMIELRDAAPVRPGGADEEELHAGTVAGGGGGFKEGGRDGSTRIKTS
jgi:hypothetical protein